MFDDRLPAFLDKAPYHKRLPVPETSLALYFSVSLILAVHERPREMCLVDALSFIYAYP